MAEPAKYSRRWVRALSPVVALATMAGGVVAMTGQADAAVTDVVGSAYGSYGNISLFGGPYNAKGPANKVTLPAGGSASAVTNTAASNSLVYGPSTWFRSGQVDLSTQGTPGSGSVTSTTTFAATAGTSNDPCSDRVVNTGVTTASSTTITASGANFTAADIGSYIEGGRYRTATNGATTASSTTVTATVTGAFTAGDVGASIEGGSIPAGATITAVTNTTTVTISSAATATASSVPIIVQDNFYGGIPANTTITAVASATSATMSAAATATKSGVHLGVTGNGSCVYFSQFTAATASTTCTANDTGAPTASTSFTGGVVTTATDNQQHPIATTAVANSPAANTSVSGYFKLGASDKESFTIKFNEQIVNADGSLTVNAAHLTATGQTAYGDVIFGQSICGVRRSTTTNVTSSVNPSANGQLVTYTATVAPAAGTGTPTGYVQFTKAGTNYGSPVQLTSGTATTTGSFSTGTYSMNAVYLGSGRTTTDGTTASNTTVTSATAAFTASDVGQPISGSRARNTTDGVTTSASTTVTSATAAFTSADVGANIVGNGIPAGAKISAFTNSTTVTISAAATASATVNISITSGIPAGATITAFTNATTVTISAAATSTASGLPLSIGAPWGYATSTDATPLSQVVN